MKIILSENQYKRIFLNEQKSSSEKNCSFMLNNNWVNEHDAPFYFQLENPFGDGYDYAWWVGDDCNRIWYRRKKELRKNPIKDFLMDFDYEWSASESEKQKLLKKKKEYYESQKKYKEEVKKNISEYDWGKEIDEWAEKHKNMGWTVFKFKSTGGATLMDHYKTIHWSTLLTIKDLVKKYPIHTALTGGHNCLYVSAIKNPPGGTKISSYSMDNVKLFQDKIDSVVENKTDIDRNQAYMLFGPPSIYYSDPESSAYDANWKEKYKYQIDNFPGNTFFLEDFYFFDPKFKKDMSSLGSYDKSNELATPLFPDGAYNFLIQWFGSSNVNHIDSKLKNSKYMFKSGCKSPSESKYSKGYQKLTFNVVAPSAKIDHHLVLQIGAGIAWVVPGAQPLAIALELVDAGIYIYEGEPFAGILGLALVTLPVLAPAIRSLRGGGTKYLQEALEDTYTYIKTKKPNSAQLESYIRQSQKNWGLDAMETKAYNQILKHGDDITKEINKIEQMSKGARNKYYKEISEEFNNIWKHNTQYGKGSKYYERALEVDGPARIIIPTIIFTMAIKTHNDKTKEEREINIEKLKEEWGLENLTEVDIKQLQTDVIPFLEESFGNLKEFDAIEFQKNFENKPAEQQKAITDVWVVSKIADTTGTNSTIYKEAVQILKNDTNNERLYDLLEILENDPDIMNKEYRELSDDVEYNWYEVLNCENDPYSEKIVNITNEDEIKKESYQNQINMYGLIFDLRSDSKYDYIEYNGYWFWKLKDKDSWNLLKTCLGCSKLQRTLNNRIKEINSKFDYELEVDKELDTNKVK